jgi:Cyclin, N-terminal domain/Cyclin, C-terminal domain
MAHTFFLPAPRTHRRSFEFSREVVAVSLNIFDRYLATLGNTCTGDEALLISLAALQIAVKLYETKRVRLRTLATLSRGQFVPSDIEAMEWKIMEALSFRLNAPTQHSFVDYYLYFIPWEQQGTGATKRGVAGLHKNVSELSKYLTELAVCDPFFVSIPNSVVALAALLNVLDELSYNKLSDGARTRFLSDLCLQIRINPYADQVAKCRARLRRMVDVVSTTTGKNKNHKNNKDTDDTMSSDRSTASSLGSAACRFVARSTRSLMGPMMYAGIP